MRIDLKAIKAGIRANKKRNADFSTCTIPKAATVDGGKTYMVSSIFTPTDPSKPPVKKSEKATGKAEAEKVKDRFFEMVKNPPLDLIIYKVMITSRKDLEALEARRLHQLQEKHKANTNGSK